MPYSDFLKKYQYHVGFLILVFASYFNLGFHHPDEHFQILEILNYKVNPDFNPAWLPWDLNEKLRSFFQIFLYYPFELLFNAFGFSPFVKVFFYKLATGCFAFYGLLKYSEQLKFDDRYLLVFFWFIPLFLARTSSESLSMGFFFWALVFLEHKTARSYLMTGLLLAFSCYARFPMLVAVAFIGLWIVIYHEKKWELGFIDLGFLIGIAIGAVIDFWGYGEWTLSVWNYFKANIIESKGNQFGVEPLWYFLEKPGLKAGPIGIFLLFGTLIYWWKNKTSQITFWTLGYVLIHSLVSHKEIRFIAPVYMLAPFMLFSVWQNWDSRIKKVFKLFFFVNLIYLVKVLFIPNTSYIAFYQYLYKNPVTPIYTLYDKHGTHLKLINRYYLIDIKMELQPIHFEKMKKDSGEFSLLTSQYREVDLAKKLNCQEVFSLYPNWLIDKNPFNFRKRSSLWKLWKCP